MKYVATIEPELFRQQMLDDAVGAFNIIAPTLPHLRETKGSVVAVTTVATVRFPARDSLSSAPKGAVEAMMRAIAFEEGRFGVRANCVGPGIMGEGMTEKLVETGDFTEAVMEATRKMIPMRRLARGRRRRSRLLPGLGSSWLHQRSETRHRRRLRDLVRQRAGVKRSRSDRMLQYEVRDHVAWVLLDRAEKLNAMDRDFWVELREICQKAGADPDVRVVLFHGAGKCFSVGGDISTFAGLDDAAARRSFSDECLQTLRMVEEIPKPTIAAVHGFGQ